VAAEYAPGMFCDYPAQQAADFAQVELRRREVSLLARIGLNVTKHGDHFLGELITVWAGIQAKKALI